LGGAVGSALLRVGVTLGLHISTLFKTIDAIVVLEFLQRRRDRCRTVLQSAVTVVPAGVYLIFVFLLVFTYNDVIVSVRFYGAYDQALNQLDARLFGTTVSAVAHRALSFCRAPGLASRKCSTSACSAARSHSRDLRSQLGRKARHSVRRRHPAGAVTGLDPVLRVAQPRPVLHVHRHFERLRFHLVSYTIQKDSLHFARLLWSTSRFLFWTSAIICRSRVHTCRSRSSCCGSCAAGSACGGAGGV